MALNRIKKRKELRQKRIMGIVITFLMIASGFGVYLSGRGAQNNTIEDTGLKFSIDYDAEPYAQYVAKIGGKEQSFYVLPSMVKDITTNDYINSLRAAQVIVMTLDPNSSLNNLQLIDLIKFNIGLAINKPVINAAIKENDIYQLPIITCDNATAEMPVLNFAIAENESIVQEDNCITVQGNMTGFLELRDRIIYDYYGVYEE